MNTAAIRERTARLGSDQIASRWKRLNPLYSSDCQTSCRNAEGHRVASLFLDDEKRGQGLGAEGSPPRSRDAALIHDTTGAQSTLHAVLRGNPATRWWRAGCDYSRISKNRALQNRKDPCCDNEGDGLRFDYALTCIIPRDIHTLFPPSRT